MRLSLECLGKGFALVSAVACPKSSLDLLINTPLAPRVFAPATISASKRARALQAFALAPKDMQVSCTGRIAPVAVYTSAYQYRQHAAPTLAPFRLRASNVRSSDSHRACWQAQAVPQRTRQRHIRATYPEPETEKERSPLDYPQVSTCTCPRCDTSGIHIEAFV